MFIKFFYKKTLFLGLLFYVLVPNLVYAKTLFDVFLDFLLIFDFLVPVLTGLALIYFIWGVVKFVANQDNENERNAARQQMIYGIIALFVIISVWGLVNVLDETFLLTNSPPPLPKIPQ